MTIPAKTMRRKTAAQLTAAASKASRNCNAHKLKATGMIVDHLAQEQGQNIALRFVNRSANVEVLLDLSAQLATGADLLER